MSYQETKVADAIRLTDYPDRPLEGYYLDSKEVQTKFNEQMIHTIQKEDGTTVSFWGFAAVDRLLEYTQKGVMVKITYTGKAAESNKYGNKSHTCTVFFDEDRRLDGFTETDPEVKNNDDLPF